MRSIRARSSRVLGAVAIAAAMATTACSQELPDPIPMQHPDDPTPRRGGIIASATFADVRTIDPAAIGDGLAPQMLEALFAGLVDYDHEGKIAPDLAESWTTSDDGTRLRFVLRQGAKFHDGEEVTADDVKRSVERSLHPKSPNNFAEYYASIKGFAAYRAKKAEHLDGVKVEGRYVVTFELEQPDSAFLPLLAMHVLRPVCKSGGDRYSDKWTPCGAGPFKMTPGGWQHGRELLVVRHDGYFKPGLPHLDGVRFLFNVALMGQRFKFLRGDQDFLRDFLSPDILKFQHDARWKAFGGYEIEKQIGGDSMNTEMAPFDNIEIRRAIASAIDREQLRVVRSSNLRVGTLPVPPGVDGYDPTLEGQKYDHAAALEHMKRAGYPYDPATGKGGYPYPIPYYAYDQGLHVFLAQVEQQQLAKIGIRTEIRVVSYAALLSLRGQRGKIAFGPGFWQQDYPEAGTFLEPLFHSRSISDDDANNWSFYKNAKVDELVDRARRELDVEKRRKVYREAQEIICDEAPWAFTHFYRYYTHWQPYVRNYKPHPLWNYDHRETWIDRTAGPTASRAIFTREALSSLFGDRSPPR